MNVLLIGGSGSLMNSMVARLHKEGHRIFVLTADKDRKKKDKFVFEYYRFDYGSESVPQVLESVCPDVTLFFGACDPAVQLDEDTRCVQYLSGFMNLLVSFAMQRKGRFVYLSSSAIFENGSDDLISEEEEPHCESPRALVLAQAEAICQSYRKNLGLDVVTLRMEPIFTIPENRGEAGRGIGNLFLQAMESPEVKCTSPDEFSVLYETDAVEFIHRILFCREHREGLYNVSSSVGVTQEKLAHYIAETQMTSLRIVAAQGSGKRRILSNKRFLEEFGMRFFSDPQKMAEKTMRYIRENPSKFRQEKPKRESFLRSLGKRLGWLAAVLIPYVENLICFIPFFMLNNRAVGSKYFDRLDFYLLYVLLFAIVYGQRQATFSALLAMAGYCFRQMYTRSSFEVFTSYNTYIWLTQLFALGLIVGYMKDKLAAQKIEKREEETYLNNRIADISDINKSNVHVKNSLQTQIINQSNSLGTVYQITSTLNQYSPEEVLFYAAEIMAKLMQTKDVAIYTVSDQEYARLFSSTSPKAQSLGRSLNYRETGAMIQTLEKHEVFINRKLDASLPLMANAIYEADRMQILVLVWGIPWEMMTLGQANLMSVISALIQDAVLRANRYMAALEAQRYESDTMVLKPDAFRALLHAFQQASEKGLTDFALLRCGAEGCHERVRGIRQQMRLSDYLGVLEDGCLYILLRNTNSQDARNVQLRLSEQGIPAERMEGTEI